MKISRAYVAIVVFALAFITAVGFLGYEFWQNQMWKMEVYGLAGYEGGTRARHDFQAGRLRLFVIAGERSDDKYSGTNDGAFEVWYPQYYSQYYPFRYSAEQMVSSYNERMRYLHEHPEKPLNITNNITKP
jgi:hypothetical protein